MKPAAEHTLLKEAVGGLSRKESRILDELAVMRRETPEQTAVALLRMALPKKIAAADAQAPSPPDELEAATLQAIFNLHDRDMAKLANLATIRRQDLLTTFRKTILNLIGRIPATIADHNVVRELDFKSVELEDGLTKIVLGNGRTFYGFPSRLKYVNVFYALRDIIPKGFTPETYAAGVDAIVRYHLGAEYTYFPGAGATVIEGGAYVGYKAVRFGEIVGPTGKVIAIEIGRQNYELLVRNIAANDMQQIITPLHCGIWKETGKMQAQFEIYASHSLAPPEEHSHYTRVETVPTESLDNIIEQNNLSIVDFINLQLNGAEAEAVEGLQRHFDDVKLLRIGAYYTRDGENMADSIERMLLKRGCTIIERLPSGNMTAVTPKWKHEFPRK